MKGLLAYTSDRYEQSHEANSKCYSEYARGGKLFGYFRDHLSAFRAFIDRLQGFSCRFPRPWVSLSERQAKL